ncbi:MAG TPA: 3-isopropylmalate dehydratase small subunit, partial [Herpetosiphonaceae bacterium]|nr:3-isopropylmalate dehydratase small subunit [Herpetosiphonaceae bacterium]
MDPITTFTAKCVALPQADIDTDQIVPARYLKVTDKAGLRDALFADWRVDKDGQPRPDFPLNQPEAAGAEILVAGNNFGCGSSREHAPWALQAAGFKAIISTYFADIFSNNALKNGLLPIRVDEETYYQLVSLCQEDPETRVTVDLERQALILPGGQQVQFPIDAFAKHCLLNGVDQMGFLLGQSAAIEDYEATHPARVHTTG